MSYCVNPQCVSPQSADAAQYCQGCGARILLQNRYRPLQPIGQGGFGKTYLARDEHLPSRPICVIKQFHFLQAGEGYAKAVRLFHEEAVRLDQLGKHPQIPQLLAHFEQSQQLFLVQEYVPGRTLAQELEEIGVFSEAKIWQLLRGILPVLQFVHQNQVIHRDIKPANIMRRSRSATLLSPPNPKTLGQRMNDQKTQAQQPPQNISQDASQISQDLESQDLESQNIEEQPTQILECQTVAQIQDVSDDASLPPVLLPRSKHSSSTKARGSDQIVLIDFGVAKLFTGAASMQTGTIIGSPEFMAPEQTRGKVFPASDLYSLGTTCLYLLTGISPWNLYDVVKEQWIWRDLLANDRTLHPKLARVLDRLVAPQMNQRYHSAEQVLQDINQPETASSSVNLPGTQSGTQSVAQPVTPGLIDRDQSILTQPLNSLLSATLGRWIPGLASTVEEELVSATGINYRELQRLLATRRWKAADAETWMVLRQALGKRSRQYLHASDLQNLPCEDLCTIDRLWLQYSGGRFGFSVQARIYQKFEGDYGSFCEKIGWLTYNPSNPMIGFQFKLSAPVGHLPSRLGLQTGGKWWQHVQVMTEKLTDCQIL